MKARFYFITTAAILFFMFPLRSWGQEEQQKQQEPKLLLGGFNTEGTITYGYRFTTIKGDKAMYDNIYNLHSGFRVMDVNLTGRAPEGSNFFADSYSISASGLGGDPYASGQLVLRKDKIYDLRVNFRQSRYYWSQNNVDNQVRAGLGVPVASGGDPSGYTTGLTADHSWATTRRMGSIDLNVRATNRLQFSFEYNRNSRDGMTLSTRSLHYPGSPGSGTGSPNTQWGTFSRANPYVVAAPVEELEDRITAGVSYALQKWVFRYRAGYQSFVQNTRWENVTSPEQSIDTSTNVFTILPPSNPNINSITAKEMLSFASWSEFRHATSPISEFSYSGNLTPWLELRGSYNYFHYTGPDTSEASFAGNARTNSAGTTFAPYAVAYHGRADIDAPMHDVNQGFTVKIKEWWKLDGDYHYSRVIQSGVNEYGSFFNGVGQNNGVASATIGKNDEQNEAWAIGTHLVDLNMEFIPRSSLVVRAGIRYLKRDAEHFIEGISDPTRLAETLGSSSQRTKSVWPTVSVYYKPVKTFSVRADLQSITSARPYTRLSPHTDIGSRFIVRYEPMKKISIEENLVIRGSKFQDTLYESRYRSNSLNVSYNFSDQFSANAGYNYESIFGRVSHVTATGTSQFNGFQQDAFINRGIRGGLSIRPVNRFGIDLSGNYLRTTGASRLYSTVPASILGGLPIVWPVNLGPITFPLIASTFYYDFPQAGRLSVDLQRSYYAEQIVKGNNFSANMLTIRWTKYIRPGGD